jgi:sialic acid synthase SpsE
MKTSRYAQETARQGLYLIAEAGSNHNGSLREAKRLVSLAAEHGADAVKFQLFSAKTLMQADVLGKLLGLEQGWTGTVKKLEFPLAWLPVLKRLADRAAIDFLCTPFDEKRLTALLEVHPPAIKISSGDCTHYRLLEQAAASGLPVILSTGASTDDEIQAAVSICGRETTALLQCVMRYPAKASAYNPSFMARLVQYAPVVGISDHTEGGLAAARAVLDGAIIVERHFTRSRRQSGADHAMSTEPDAFSSLRELLLESLRARMEGVVETGDEAERVYARRGMYCQRKIAQGDMFDHDNCIALRPAIPEAVPASEYRQVMGKKAKRAYDAGDPVLKDEIEKEA